MPAPRVMHEMARNRTLTARQERALVALLAHPSVHEAAQAAKVGLRTLWAWLKDPVFAEAYRQARQEAVKRAIGRLQQIATEAVDTLHAVMADAEAPAAAKMTAARATLDLAVKAVELEDLETRVQVLEELSNGTKRPR